MSHHHLRRRTPVPRRVCACGRRDRRAPARVLRAVSPGHRRRDRAVAPPAPGAGAVRLSLDPLSRSTPVRGHPAPLQPRQFLRRELRCLDTLRDGTDLSRVTNGRFKGGYTTRHYGRPQHGVHAVQMELACRGYLREPAGAVDEGNWPCAWDEEFAAPMRAVLERILTACIGFASAAQA